MWVAFLCGPALLVAVPGGFSNGGFHPEAMLGSMVAGLFLGLPFLAGLAMATRLFSGPVSRIVGGLVLGVTLIVACAAALFAGCMCLMTGHSGLG